MQILKKQDAKIFIKAILSNIYIEIKIYVYLKKIKNISSSLQVLTKLVEHEF